MAAFARQSASAKSTCLPITKPSAPTNLTHHEALDINVPIACSDVAVLPGEVLVGDRDGVMVIPAHLADKLAEECTAMEMYKGVPL